MLWPSINVIFAVAALLYFAATDELARAQQSDAAAAAVDNEGKYRARPAQRARANGEYVACVAQLALRVSADDWIFTRPPSGRQAPAWFFFT